VAAAPLDPLLLVRQLSRGRTAPGAAPVVAVADPVPSLPPANPEPTAAPAASAPAAAAPAAAPAPAAKSTAGTGVGTGVGAGTGGGGGGTDPAPTARPAGYVPLELPKQPIDHYRIGVRITDAVTRKPLADVCVIIGTGSCGPEKPHTNEIGVWAMDVPRSPSATQWDIGLIRSGYQEVFRRVVTSGEDVWLVIGLRPSR
jgi:hypothetical protein